MSKYKPLRDYFAKLPASKNELVLSLDEIGRILGFPLASYARTYPAFWANTDEDHNPWSKIGNELGWKAQPMISEQKVTFRRDVSPKSGAARVSGGTPHAISKSARLRPEDATPATASPSEEYTPEGGDERPLVERQIRARRGQQAFRDALIRRYGRRCMITGSELLDVIEAAHIKPYRKKNDHLPENGLLLRSDVHTLFDLDLVGIHPETLRVELHPRVAHEYRELARLVLRCPAGTRPSDKALTLRYEQFRNRLTEAE